MLQINCFQMEEKASHSFVRISPVYEVNVRRSDIYSEVISKICAGLELEETDECRLFTAGGSVISDTSIVIGDREMSWTLGSYLSKKHISPDKLKLGVGYLKDAHEHPHSQPKRMKVAKGIVNRHTSVLYVIFNFVFEEFQSSKTDQDDEYEGMVTFRGLLS